jgi:tetratricopeptide (TPR) repeat protein
MPTDWGVKKYLIIDDFSAFRHSVKKMLQSLGAKDMDDSGDPEEAIRMLSKKNYDVILCDFNLGEDRRDGQQILEEVKFRSLIKPSTTFIMVTAENTMTMVMSTLEYVPDGYLIKPFVPEVLRRRLETLIDRKKDIEEIESAIQKMEHLRAISICDDLSRKKPANILDFLQMKANICFMIGNYDDAQAVYERVLTLRNIPWARFGLGKVYFHRKQYIEARDTFEETIKENGTFMEAYDWLAKTMEELDEMQKAQDILSEAIQISPKAILRQKTLAEISYRNGDYDTAEKAYRKAVRLGKHSCFRSPTDHAGLAKVSIVKGLLAKALEITRDIRKEFGGAREAEILASVMDSFIHKAMSNEPEAAKSINDAARQYEAMSGRVSNDISLDLAKGFIASGNKAKGMSILEWLARNHYEDEKMLRKVKHVLEETGTTDEGEKMIASARQDTVKLNNQGVALVEQGRLDEAIEFFSKASERLPDNVTVNTNATRAIIIKMEKSGRDDRLLFRARKHLDRLKTLAPTDARYQKLLVKYAEISTQLTNRGQNGT